MLRTSFLRTAAKLAAGAATTALAAHQIHSLCEPASPTNIKAYELKAVAPLPAAPPRPTGRPLTIVITGCTSGLGQALAREFASLGHTVVGRGRREDRLAAMRSEFRPPHVFHACDVSDEAAVAALAASLRDQKIDIVVANAGANNHMVRPWELDAAEFRRVVDVNLNGVFHVTRHLLPLVIEQAREDGASLKRLVNISSGLGHSTNAVQCAYSASKWGVEALSKSTAQALKAEGLGKRVVCVPLAPGVIRSEMNPLAWAKPAEEWAPEAARFIIGLGPKDSGASLSVPGYYSAEYVSTWTIADGAPLPEPIAPR